MAAKKINVVAVHKVGVMIGGKFKFVQKGEEISLPEDEAKKLLESGGAVELGAYDATPAPASAKSKEAELLANKVVALRAENAKLTEQNAELAMQVDDLTSQLAAAGTVPDDGAGDKA